MGLSIREIILAKASEIVPFPEYLSINHGRTPDKIPTTSRDDDHVENTHLTYNTENSCKEEQASSCFKVKGKSSKGNKPKKNSKANEVKKKKKNEPIDANLPQDNLCDGLQKKEKKIKHKRNDEATTIETQQCTFDDLSGKDKSPISDEKNSVTLVDESGDGMKKSKVKKRRKNSTCECDPIDESGEKKIKRVRFSCPDVDDSVASQESADKEHAKKLCDAAIQYLNLWNTSRNLWKFSKARQIWLIHNMYKRKIDDATFIILLEYIQSIKGNARNWIKENAIKSKQNFKDIQKSTKDDNERKHCKQMKKRAKKVIKIL